MKENKKRIIFWGIVWIIFVSMSVIGYIYNRKFYKAANSPKDLTYISDTFNELESAISNNFESSIENDNIVIYSTSNEDEDDIIFKYRKNGDIEYITSTFSRESTIGKPICKYVIEAVYKANGGTKNIINRYSMDSFQNTSIEDGVRYDITDEDEIVSIRLNIDLYETIDLVDYFMDFDLEGLKESLDVTSKFQANKNDNVLYINMTDEEYQIFIETDDEDKRLKSLANIINIIYKDLYMAISDGNGNINLTTEDNNYYKIVENPTFETDGVFNNKNNLFEIIIYK